MTEDTPSAAPAGDGTAVIVETEPTQQTPQTSPEDLAALRRQLEEANRRADTATARAAEAEGRAAQSHSARISAEEAAIDHALAAAETEAETLEAALTAAGEAGKFGEVGKLTRQLSDVQFRIGSLKGQKQFAERNRTATPPAEDPRLASYRPSVQQWIKTHPQFLADEAFRANAIRAHHAAIGDGIAEDSPQYFEFIEQRLGLRQAPQREEPEEQPAEPAGRVAPARPAASSRAAPPSRQGGQTPRAGTNGTKVQLTPEERDIADSVWDDLPPAERYARYAQEKLRLINDGKIGRPN